MGITNQLNKPGGLLAVCLCFAASTVNAGEAIPARFDLQAHRGGLGLMTENSLQAFANALELGVTTLELDIQITADGMAVVTHDRQVQPHKCRDTRPAFIDDPQFPYVGDHIRNLTLAQVKTLNCGYQQLPGYPEQRVVEHVTMPLLAEVFQLFKRYGDNSVMLNIETKVEAAAPEETAPRSQFIDAVLAEIDIWHMRGQVTIQSFDWGTLHAWQVAAPDIPLIALTNGQSFLRCDEPGRSPWLGDLDMDDFDCDVVAAVASFNANALSPVHGDPQDGRYSEPDYVPFVNKAMVESAHARGIEVIPWTVDDKATMHYLMDLGVDGIITNYPDRLRQVMAERGLPLPAPL